MRYNTQQDKQQSKIHFELLKYKITTNGRQLFKNYHNDSRKIWNRIYEEMEKMVSQKGTYFKMPLFTIEVHVVKRKYLIKLHKPICTIYFGHTASDSDYIKIIKDLNSMFMHYGLEITSQFKNRKNPVKETISNYKIYEVNFVENSKNCIQT